MKYATLYDAHSWREARRLVDGLILDPALGGKFFLPYDAEEAIFCSLSYDQKNYFRLRYRERDWIERFYAPQFNLPGNVPWFYREENLAWPSFAPGKFTLTTIEKSPFNVYISGRDASNYPVMETVVMQGIINADNTVTASSLTTQNTYQVVTSFSKDVTQTPLTVSPQSGSLIVVPPATTELIYSQFALYPVPIFQDTTGTVYTLSVRIEVKLKPDPLDNDMSVPRISHIWEALVNFTTSALWKRLQQLNKAQADNQDAVEHVKAAINVEKNQSEFSQQVVPTRYESGDYLGTYDYGPATSWNPFGGYGR